MKAFPLCLLIGFMLVPLPPASAQNELLSGSHFLLNNGDPYQPSAPGGHAKSGEVLKLLFENKKDEAVAEAVARLNLLLPSFLAIDLQDRNRFDQEVNFVQFLKVYDLEDEILAAVEVPDDAPPEKRIVRAAFGEMLGDLLEAEEGYRAVLEKAPGQDGVRMRLIHLLAEKEDLEQSAAQLALLSPEGLRLASQALAARVQSIPEDAFEHRLLYAELLAACFEHFDPQQHVPAPWLWSLLDHSLGQSNYGERIRFPDLYAATIYSVGYNNPEQEERSREIDARRREVHDRLCRALLELPQFAEVGFERLSGLGLRDGEDSATYAKMAERILLEMEPAPVPAAAAEGGDAGNSQNTYRTAYHEGWVPFLSPVEFLIQTATQGGDDSLLRERVLPRLRASGRDEVATFVDAMLDLAASPQAEFVSKAVALVEGDHPDVELGNLMRRIFEMRDARGLAIDAGPIILAYLGKGRLEPYSNPAFVAAYGLEVAERGREAFVRFLSDAGEVLLGPTEGHKAFIQQHYDPNSYAPGTPGNAARNYVAFLAQMVQTPATVAAPFNLASELELLHPNDYQIRNQLQNAIAYHRLSSDPAGFYAFLKEMRFLDDLETLPFYPMPNFNRNTLFGYVFYSLCRVQPNDKARVLDPIIDHPEETFGKAILAAAAKASSSSNSQQEAVTLALEPFMDRVVALPEERRNEILYWYANLMSRNGLSSSLKRAAPKVAAWYEPLRNAPILNEMMESTQRVQRGRRSEPTLEDFLAVERREELDRFSGLDYVANRLAQSLDPESGLENLKALARHHAELSRQPVPHQPGVQPVPNVTPIVATWLTKKNSLEALGESMALLAQHDSGEHSLMGSMGNAVRSALSQESFQDPAASAGKYLGPHGDVFDERLTPYFAERFAALDEPERRAIFEWGSGQDSKLAREWRVAAALTLAPVDDGQEAWASRLADPSVPLHHRIQTATVIGPVAVAAQAWDVAEAVKESFLAAWEAEDLTPPNSATGTFLLSLIEAGPAQVRAVDLVKELLSAWSDHLEETPMTVNILAKILKLDESYGVDIVEWAERLPGSAKRQPDFLMLLVREAPPEMAASALPWAYLSMPAAGQGGRNGRTRHVRYINGRRQVIYGRDNGLAASSGPFDGSGRMDGDLWKRMEAVLAAVPNPGERFFAEVLFSSLQDEPSLKGIPPRAERLQSLTRRYDREVFASPYLAEHTVSWLCSLNEGVTDETRDAVTHFGSAIDFRDLAAWQDGNLRASRQNLLNHHVQDASKNRPDAFAKMLTQMLQEADPRTGEAQQLLESYCQGFPQSLFKGDELPSAERAQTYLPLLRQLTEMSREVHWNGRDECISGNVVMHILAGETETYRSWLLSLDEDRRRQVFSEANLDQMIYLVRDGLNQDNVSQDRRFEVLNGLFAVTSPEGLFADDVRFGGSSDGDVFARMIGLNVLKKEEILEHGPVWAETHPRQGAAHAELAAFQEEAGLEEDAILSYLQATVRAPLSNRDAYTRYHIAKTRLLLKAGRTDAAMSWLEFLDPGRLDGDREGEVEELRRKVRFDYLLEPRRLESRLAQIRQRLSQDARDFESWQDLAELLAAGGHEKIQNSDYFRGVAYYKIAFAILTRLRAAGSRLDEGALLARVKSELSRSLMAVGMGGRKRDLIERRSRWHYHYERGGLDGDAWKELAGPEGRIGGNWKVGRGQLGYGDGDEATVLNFGEDEDDKPITAYFRFEFDLEDLEEYDQLMLRVLHDDGVAVYLNGRLIAMNNLPENGLGPGVLAPDTRSSELENEYWQTPVPAESLRAGINLIAAEVHQNAPDSSDLGFDLELYAEGINATEIVAEAKSGALMKFVKDWKDLLPPDFLEMMEGL